jgi:pimeloyl-ACP methyl ester carboxylesterase/DNA-binding winged helix-turn-helix (wHTH) protein/class 3 adenylate cyclase
MKNTPSVVYEFGKFRLDAVERLLFDGTKIISLTPKAFEILLLLVENCGHALTKEEMLAKVWQDSFVEENNLAQNISILRRIIGDEAIETVPRRGYRFIAQVKLLGEEPPQSVVIHEKISAKIIIDDESGDLKTNIMNAIHGLTHAPLPAHLPETKYVQNGEVNIAYQTVGHGDIDIVFVMGWVSHLEYFWKEPHFAQFLSRLASFSRLILFDKRGTGLSDRVPINELPTLEERMDDVRAVMDAVGSERAVLLGVSEGGPMCSLFAATYPERTTALIMIGSYAKRIRDEDYPWGVDAADREEFFEMMKRDWGKPVGIEERAPSMANDEVFRDWWATCLRMGASPGAAVALTKMNAEIDIRQVLPTIRVPSLVIHRSGDLCLKVEEGRFLASQISGCKYVELGGIDHLPFVGEQDEILDEIEEFLTGVRHADEYDRVLATVLAIKIVNPTFYENQLGKVDWSDLIERSRDFVSRQIQLFKGREVSFDENGILATFDGPARAIRCATAITDAAVRLGLRVKTGLHTGECDVLGDKISGVAVNLAGKIADDAEFGEILASRTVKDLVAGSGLNFVESNLKTFDDVQGSWRIFSVKR